MEIKNSARHVLLSVLLWQVVYDRLVTDASKWPADSYGLYKVVSGCPDNDRKWSTQSIQAESTRSTLSWSIPSHVSANYTGYPLVFLDTGFLFLDVCVQNRQKPQPASEPWPSGTYCVIKVGPSCPAGSGFKEVNGTEFRGRKTWGATAPPGRVGTFNRKTGKWDLGGTGGTGGRPPGGTGGRPTGSRPSGGTGGAGGGPPEGTGGTGGEPPEGTSGEPSEGSGGTGGRPPESTGGMPTAGPGGPPAGDSEGSSPAFVTENVLDLCCIEDDLENPTFSGDVDAPFMLPKHPQTDTCPSAIADGVRVQDEWMTYTLPNGDTVVYEMCYYQPALSSAEHRFAAQCGDGWAYFDGYCYSVQNELTTWWEAAQDCQSMDATLATITSIQEFSHLRDMILKRADEKRFGHTVGLIDEHIEGRYRWLDGTPVDPRISDIWPYYEPNDSFKAEDCGNIWQGILHGTFVHLVDSPCYNKLLPSICKRLAIDDAANVAEDQRVQYSADTFDIDKARDTIDGDMATCMTISVDSERWWRVDLMQSYLVEALQIVTGYSSRLPVVDIRVSQTSTFDQEAELCAEAISSDWLVKIVHCQQPTEGRYVSISGTKQDSEFHYLEEVFMELCEVRIFGKHTGCNRGLGISTGEVADSQLQTSSWQQPYSAEYLRLGQPGIWCADDNDTEPYILIHLATVHTIQRVLVEGDDDLGHITAFRLGAGLNWQNLISVEAQTSDHEVFRQGTRGDHLFDMPVSARVVRLTVVDYELRPCAKLELYGCQATGGDPCAITVNSTTTITSPGYPGYYGSGTDCQWTVLPSQGRYAMINMTRFDLYEPYEDSLLESCGDKLTLYQVEPDNQVRLAERGGQDYPLIIADRDDTHIRLHLSSCLRETFIDATGFTAVVDYVDCPGCNFGREECDVTCRSSCGYLSSPFYPAPYKEFADCTWLLIGNNKGYVELTFLKLFLESSLPDCGQDYVVVSDARVDDQLTEIGRYCIANPPLGPIYSNLNRLHVRMVTDEQYSGRGFLAYFTSIDYVVPEDIRNKIHEDINCPAGWVRYSNACFGFSQQLEAISWFQAEAICQSHHAHLTSVMNEEEMLVLHFLLTSRWTSGDKTAYIGLIDRDPNRRDFVWTDQRPLIYTAWADGQPDGGEMEGCTMIDISSLHSVRHWHDVLCADKRAKQLVCKKDLAQDTANVVDIGASNYTTEFLRPNNMFRCGSGEYTSVIYRCDGIQNCFDSSDEENCTNSACTAEKFTCDNGQCIHTARVCDFHADCQDSSDESLCVLPECSVDQFRCQNGQCIQGHLRCNLLEDCVDGSDENNCDQCQLPETFQCYDGRCMPRSVWCDTMTDCFGQTAEDERGCFSWRYDICEGKTNVTCTHDLRNNRAVVEFSASVAKGILSNRTESAGTLQRSYNLYYSFDVSDDQMFGFKDLAANCWQFIETDCLNLDNDVLIDWHAMNRDDMRFSKYDFVQNCTDNSTSCMCGLNVTNTHTLPLKTLVVETTSLHDNLTLHISPFVCDTSYAGQELADQFICDSGQVISYDERCIYGKNKYGMTRGCGDMSHLQGCDAPVHPRKECLDNPGGTNYRGVLNRTIDGQICRNWMYDYPYANPFKIPERYNEETMFDAHNFCRAMLGESRGLICLLMDVNDYGQCSVPMCEEGDPQPYECTENHVKCPGNYCIPIHHVCDGVWHCPNGEDEQQCDRYTCPGLYRCLNSKTCVSPNQICDGEAQCPAKDDELFCNVQCPPSCSCFATSVICQSSNLTSIPTIHGDVRYLDMNQNEISDFGGVDIPFLVSFILARNRIQQLSAGSFSQLHNLVVLDLSYNELKVIPANAFEGLGKLKRLILHGNRELFQLETGAFTSLHYVESLELPSMSLDFVGESTFRGMNSLLRLDLSGNKITGVDRLAFDGLSALSILNLESNPIDEIPRSVFSSLDQLEYLYSDDFRACCFAEQVPRDQCYPEQDAISSCGDLMQRTVLRVFLWILGVVALTGNAFVVSWKLFSKESSKQDFVLMNLATSDFLMGVYMIGIASVDAHYRGNFVEHIEEWRQSTLCQILGFLATTSSEASLFFLCIITMDRLISMLYPLKYMRASQRNIKVMISIGWMVAFLLSVIPLMSFDYFGDNYYGRSSVCLALPITNERPQGWQYSAAIYVFLNSVGFLVVAFGYCGLYNVVKSAVGSMGGLQKKKQIALVRKIMLIVLTNLACWLPIISMGIAALNGGTIPGEMYAWTIVFILPVNSATNPVLYTISTIDVLKPFRRQKELSSSGKTSKTGVASSYHKMGMKERPIPVASVMLSADSEPLGRFIKQDSVTLVDITEALRTAAHILSTLHRLGFCHGELSVDDIMIRERLGDVYFMEPESFLPASDLNKKEDILALGNVVRDVVKAIRFKSTHL